MSASGFGCLQVEWVLRKIRTRIWAHNLQYPPEVSSSTRTNTRTGVWIYRACRVISDSSNWILGSSQFTVPNPSSSAENSAEVIRIRRAYPSGSMPFSELGVVEVERGRFDSLSSSSPLRSSSKYSGKS